MNCRIFAVVNLITDIDIILILNVKLSPVYIYTYCNAFIVLRQHLIVMIVKIRQASGDLIERFARCVSFVATYIVTSMIAAILAK